MILVGSCFFLRVGCALGKAEKARQGSLTFVYTLVLLLLLYFTSHLHTLYIINITHTFVIYVLHPNILYSLNLFTASSHYFYFLHFCSCCAFFINVNIGDEKYYYQMFITMKSKQEEIYML